MSAAVRIVEADLAIPGHQRDVVAMTAAYACDPMGNGCPLPPHVLAELVPRLQEHPTAMILLAYLEDEAVGIATCFLGFSTFSARPLINIHDLAVLPEHRGRGIARRLLAAVEAKATELGCAKVTLEVQENNIRARGVYEAAGFAHAVYGDDSGGSLFYTKTIDRHSARPEPE
jgi:GNAT superfamily N-acetyltransferase